MLGFHSIINKIIVLMMQGNHHGGLTLIAFGRNVLLRPPSRFEEKTISTEDTRIRPFSFIRALTVLLIAAFLLGLQPVPEARAATITVTNTHDSGAGSLRQAIDDANPGDTIDLGVTGTITLDSGQLTIDKDLTITRTGSGTLTISGSFFRVFYIDSGATITMSGLTIADGQVGSGGGIYNLGTLTIADSTLSGNTASHGGGIYNRDGTLTIENSTLSSNAADGDGGGIYVWLGTLTIENSLLRDNTADKHGGGIYNRGTLTIENSTLSGNTADDSGGGIYQYEWIGKTNLHNTTLSENVANTGDGGGSGADGCESGIDRNT